MKLAVKMYKDTENPDNLPGDWPCECLELRDGDRCPTGWAEMTEKEYHTYRATHKDSYEAWFQNVYTPKEKERHRLRKLVSNLETLADSYKELQEQGEILTPEELNIIAKYDKYKERLAATE